MKTKWPIVLSILLLPFIFANISGDEYIVLSWNDLGMHCSNKDFSKIAVLPPFNNLKAQVIRKGNAETLPEIITTGISVHYSIPGNTYSVGKTNFWSYSQQLFGVTLAPNIGLTGVGLTGTMNPFSNHYAVEGVPVTPYTDNNLLTENPYQLALIEVYNSSNNLLASTQPVIPVSNELSCVSSGCHSSEQAILNEHPREGGFNPNATPILCANCHSDNALGMPGQQGLRSFSFVIHDKHKDKTNNCYKCHPGPNTQCFRDVMFSEGMTCQNCHGSMSTVASSIENGREPWLEEPSCGASNCHGSNYGEETGKLFRNSVGHGGLYCSACHGSPHAIQPTIQPNDNVQNIALQGFSGVLRRCEVCHGTVPTSAGPHGYLPSTLNLTVFLESLFAGTAMNKAQDQTGNQFTGPIADKITIELHNANPPFTLAAGPFTVNLNTNGSASLSLPASMNSSYYIVVKHRNSVETWNGTPLSIGVGTVNYNFSLAANQAYGNNLKQINGKYVIYAGDVNKDGFIDAADMINVDNQAANFAQGYLPDDVNGDGDVTFADMVMVNDNSTLFIGKIVP
ncbi:MAG: hypothetical protein IPH45_09815 [Bacteroidales bacterium]|nr:hypothetical protein [Bacteroidales bacterium]